MLFSTQMWTPAACAFLWTDVKHLQNRSHVAVDSAEPMLLYLWSIFIPKLTAAMSFFLQRRLTSCHLQDKQMKKKKIISYKEQCGLSFLFRLFLSGMKRNVFIQWEISPQPIDKQRKPCCRCRLSWWVFKFASWQHSSQQGWLQGTHPQGWLQASKISTVPTGFLLCRTQGYVSSLWARTSDCSQFRKCCKSTLTTLLLVMVSALLWGKPTDRHPLGLLKQTLKGKANLCCSACPISKRTNWINNK